MRKKNGFTLVEMIVVIGVIALVLPSIFGLFFLNLNAQRKTMALNSVKQQGDYALNIMQSVIRRSAIGILSSDLTSQECEQQDTSYNAPNFKDNYGKWFAFNLQNGKIASYSGTLEENGSESIDLTDDQVQVTSFSVVCQKDTEFSQPVITIRFTLKKIENGLESTRVEETSTLNYYTKVKLRN